MIDDQLGHDAARGTHAEQLLRDEVLVEAFAALERDYVAAWRESPARDTDARERLWQAVNIIGKVKSHLQSVANSGKLARKEIDDLTHLGDRKKLFGVV